MRQKALLASVVSFIVLSALVALAQPKKGAPPKEPDKKAATKDDKKDTKEGKDAKDAKEPEAPPTPSSSAANASDLGESPPKQTQKPDEKTKPSPLTPRANEFPEGRTSST